MSVQAARTPMRCKLAVVFNEGETERRTPRRMYAWHISIVLRFEMSASAAARRAHAIAWPYAPGLRNERASGGSARTYLGRCLAATAQTVVKRKGHRCRS